jgi:hypothetical protein
LNLNRPRLEAKSSGYLNDTRGQCTRNLAKRCAIDIQPLANRKVGSIQGIERTPFNSERITFTELKGFRQAQIKVVIPRTIHDKPLQRARSSRRIIEKYLSLEGWRTKPVRSAAGSTDCGESYLEKMITFGLLCKNLNKMHVSD